MEKIVIKIPDTSELKLDSNSDRWLEALKHEMKLTFKETANVTNSICIDDKSLTVHQYTLDIFVKEEDKYC